jgi:hypothetical protein
MNRLIITGFIGLALVLPASAQFYPGSVNFAPSETQGVCRGLSGSQDQGANIRSFSVGGNGGFWGGGGGANVATPWSTQYGAWIQQANSGTLSDDIASQQADFQAAFQNQDLRLRKLQLKRAAFDEMMYEKMNTPPPELVREQERQERLTRARNTPPDNEIWSGQALNEMLTNIQRIEAREGVRGYKIPLNPDIVKHLNVSTTSDDSGSNEFFKATMISDWPLAFITDDFAADRKRIQDNINALVNAQKGGRIDQAAVVDSRKAREDLKSKLFANRSNVSFTDYANALEFLNRLDNAISVLSKPGARNFVDGAFSAQGETVGELITYMTSKGLRFARATPGFEPSYTAFYQNLVTYDISLSRLVGDQSTYMFSPGKK